MHADHGRVPEEYRRYLAWKLGVVALTFAALIACLVVALGVGPAGLSTADVLASLAGTSDNPRADVIVRGIRLPQALAAMVAGGGLAVSGAVMQAILRNPLGSPFTLGISHAAAFGAAFAVMAISRLRGARPETMVLTGVALGALFTAATMFLQYFATDVQLAAMVFWTFGDTARATWGELGLMTAVVGPGFFYFWAKSWSYNAMDAGDETAKGLGVRVERVRIVGMLLSSLVTAVLIAFLGIIGFVGLVVPHMFRRIIGADHRFLLPASLVGGALLLLASDTAARLILAPHLLPVSVLTAFLGAPTFLYLIVRGKRA
jgi:iron complex transport system permease protein